MTNRSSPTAYEPPDGAGLRILLVEDNPGDADLIQARLGGSTWGNVEILWTERLADAVRTLGEEAIDVAFLDLNLPDSTGIDTVTAVHRAAPAVPVVVLTGNEGSEIGLAAVQAGAQDFLGKGVARGDTLWRVAHYAIERQKTQQRIRESERFLQSSLDALSARIAILDETGVALFVNRAWSDFVGIGHGDLQACLGTNYLVACDEAAAQGQGDAARLAAGARAVISGERDTFEIEYQYGPPSNSGWTLIRVTPFPGTGGIRIAVAHEDITDLKKSQLREQRLARVLRGVRNVNQLITKTSDRQTLVQRACEALTESLSYGKAWIMLPGSGDSPPLLGAAGMAGLEDEFVETLRSGDWPECVRRAMDQASPTQLRFGASECSSCPVVQECGGARLVAGLGFEGQTFGAMAVLIPSGTPLDDEEETLFGELVEDIAFALHKIQLAEEHQAAQRALAQSEERYRKLFENATVGIFTTSLKGEALVVNPAMAAMLGFATSEEAVAYYRDLATQLYVHPEQRQEVIRLLNRDGEVREFEYEARARDGRHVWLSMSARIAPGDGETEPLIEGFTADITSRKEAESRMRESERLHRLLADNTMDCIWLMDLSAFLQYVNPACEELTGYRPEEMVGRNLREFCEEDAFAAMADAMLRVLPQAGSAVFETFLRRRDGTPVAVEITGGVVLDENGTPCHFQGVARDITERRRAIEEIRSRENLLNKIFDTIPVGLWLVDPDGRLYRNNEEGRRIWGCPPSLPVGEYGACKAWRLPSREEIADEDWALPPTVQGKATVLNELLEIEGFDGERRAILHSSAPVLNEAGQVETTVLVNLDVTELQQAQAERERLRLAIEQSQETIVVTDGGGTIQYVNPAFERTTGYSRSEAVGKNPRILASGQQGRAFYQELWATINGGKTWRGRFVNRRKDGSLYTEEATISPVLDESARIISFVAVKRDVTEQLRMQRERERLEEQVEHSQRLESIGRLAGGVAHDLNNLLMPILGYAEMLMLDLKEDGECRQSVAEIVKAGRRARGLIAQLLAFGRRQLLEVETVDLNEVIASFENLLRRTIREDVEFHIFPARRLPAVKADVGQLEQIIMNLAVNAQDAMPGGGTLTFETALVELADDHAAAPEGAEPGWYVRLSVGDTGCGMDEETKSRIFEPFFTTKGRNEGTGLGLATVYGIVKQHGGTIAVSSAPGEGTTFNVYLPVAEKGAEQIRQFLEAPSPTGGSETILLAEDDEQVQKLARAVLRREGYKVLTAAGGEEAIRLLADGDQPVDMLLTDVIMPDINGRALYDRLARMRPGLKVLYMSGYTQNVIARHGVLEAGLNFIQKPFGVHAFTKKVREILDS